MRAVALLVALAPLWAMQPAQAGRPVANSASGTVQLVSKTPAGEAADDDSYDSDLSADGSVVVYQSIATNLTHDPQNAYSDVFLWDQPSDTTIQVSQGLSGAAPNSYSYAAAVTADGSYVVFCSAASNLVTDDTNGAVDVFVYEVATGEVLLVSVGRGGAQSDGASFLPDISGDGRYVVFASDARNLVAGDTNGRTDVFRVDRSTGVTTRVSVGPDGEQLNGWSNYPAISGDGNFIAVQSLAQFTGLGDFNNKLDIIVYPRTRGAVELVSVTPEGVAGNGDSAKPTLSDDGRYVAFESRASDLVSDDYEHGNDIFVRDRAEQATALINRTRGGKIARGLSSLPSISGDGAHVAYESDADKLVGGKTNNGNVFAFDRNSGVTTLVSHLPNGRPPQQGASTGSALGISSDGTYMSFSHSSRHLVKDPNVKHASVYLHTSMP